MANSWFTFLHAAPDLSQIAIDLKSTAEFDSIRFPAGVANDAFDLRCRLCGAALHAELFVLTPNSRGEQILSTVIADAGESRDEDGKRLVLTHLRRTEFMMRTLKEFDPDCDCNFRFHQVVAGGRYLWYVGGQFADEIDVWLDLSSDETPGDATSTID